MAGKPGGMTTALAPARRRHAPWSSEPARIEALDLVRLLAVLGMIATHLMVPLATVPTASGVERTMAEVTGTLAEGTTSTLFAVLGGASLVLAARGRLRNGDRRGAVLAGAVRGALIAGVGLVLELLPSAVMVVLVPFGLSMMIASPLLLVRSRTLLVIAGLLAAGGSSLRAVVPGEVTLGAPTLPGLTDPVTVVRGLFLTGMYPVLTWLPFLLAGMVLVRSLLRWEQEGRAARWSVRALLLGSAAALTAYGVSAAVEAVGAGEDALTRPLLARPHTGTPGDMIATVGVSVAVIAAAVLVLPPAKHPGAAPVRALRAAGAAPLTIYAGHVLLTAAAMLAAVLASGGDLTTVPWYVAGAGILLVHVALALALGGALAALDRRGPLEALVSGSVRRAVRALSSR